MVVYVIGRFNEFGGSNELVSSNYSKIEEKLEHNLNPKCAKNMTKKVIL